MLVYDEVLVYGYDNVPVFGDGLDPARFALGANRSLQFCFGIMA